MVNIKDLSLEQITDYLGRMGEPPYRAWQVARWVFRRGCLCWDEMTDLPKELRAALKERFSLTGATLRQRQVSRRGDTVKYLLGLGDLLVGRLLVYDALFMSFAEIKVERNPACPACA